MSSQLLNTTFETDLEPLTSSGLPVYQTAAQIRNELRRSCGEDHARLLAEPNPDTATGAIQWYTGLPGEPQKLTALGTRERAAVEVRLGKLVWEIGDRVGVLEKSNNLIDKQVAKALSDALQIPGEDHIFVVGGVPVLTGWGHIQRGPQARREILRKLADRVLAPPASPPIVPPSQGGSGLVAPPLTETSTVIIRERVVVTQSVGSWAWLGALLWVLFVLILLGINHLLLEHCALGLPGTQSLSGTWLNYCPRASAVAAFERRTDLEDRLAALRRELEQKQQACLPPPPQAAETKKKSAEARKEILEKGGRIGKYNVKLKWEGSDDIDLHIACPDGSAINFQNRANCGGKLDIDRNAAAGLEARPIENVFLEEGAQPGRYTVRIHRYTNRTSRTEPTPFEIQLLFNGEIVQTERGGAEETLRDVFTFEVPGS